METKKEEGKTVDMNGQKAQQMAANGQPEPVYKFTPEAYATLSDYLLSRPIKDVQGIYKAFYKHGQKDPFYKQEAINRLIEYLMSCPMGEVEPVVDMLQGGGLQQYLPQVDPETLKKKTDDNASEATEAPAETK